MAKSGGDGGSSLESLANNAIAAGCLQAVMSMVHPELVKFVAFQKDRVARSDAETERSGGSSSRYFRRRDRGSKPTEGAEGSNLSPEQQTDLSFQLKFLRQHWHSHLRFYGLDREMPAVVQRALVYRNKVSHQSHLTLAQYENAIATFERLAEIIECNVLIRQQIRDLVTKLLSFSSLGQAAGSKEQLAPAGNNPQVKQKRESQPDPVSVTPTPPPATLDQILQHNYLYEEEDPLWVDLKLIGNDYFKEENYTEAIEAYSQGLDVAPNQAVLFGNRAMCYLRLKEFECAREDAEDAMDADNYESVKYYRLLSEAMMGMQDYDEAKEICTEGLELDPKDATLLSRQRAAEAMIEKEKKAAEEEKKRREQEERAKIKAANAAAEAAANRTQDETRPGKSNSKSNKKKNKSKKKAPEMELVRMINYQDVPAKWIETHTRGSRRLEIYQQGMESLVVAAKALLQVTDSIGTPGRSKLPLNRLVKEGMLNLRKAGEAGVAEAWFRLGVLYSSSVRKGMPLTADPREMMECFHKAAALRPFIKPPGNRVFPHQGVAEAENELGVCYRDGIPAPFVQADLEKAFQFFLRSAEHDYPVGQYHVAVAYSTGSGTTVDAFAARMWTSRAAQHGLPEAQQYLAQLFEKGYGGKRDERQAREWTLAANQNRLTDLLVSHDFADVGVTAIGGDEIADKFANNPTVSQRGKEVFQAFYDAYLDEDSAGSGAEPGDIDFDDDDIQITKVSSYTPRATSSSDQMCWSGIYRPPSAVIDAEIQARATAGGIMASKYLGSEKLLGRVGDLLVAGDIKAALRDLKKADLIWERPKGVFTTATSSTDLLPKVLKEAGVSLQLNARDSDAAYVVGRWEMLSDQDIISHWKRCVKMHPNEAAFHFYLGAAYLTVELYNDAMDSMETALAIEKKPDWLYWFASPMLGLGMMDSAVSVLKEYVDTYPPDERFMPDAYYSLGALYLKQFNHAMATVYHELGQMAESVAVRFPAFHPRVLIDIPKETLRSGMKKNGYMESSVIASVLAENMVECGFCKCMIKPTQLLGHKLSKCPRRTVVCQDCNDRMVFDALQAHRQAKHHSVAKSKGKGKGKKRAQPVPAPNAAAKASDTNSAIKQAGKRDVTMPKFHFAGAILEITKGKSSSKHTVFTLKTAVGQRWTLRVNHNSEPGISKAIDGAAVDNSMLVFWRRSPSLEMIDRRALTVPMDGEKHGQDVTIYVLKCSIQSLAFELCQLRHNTYVENGLLCSACNIPPFPGESFSGCSACKAVKYCSRDCQRSHWKRIHRHLCPNAVLLSHCTTMSEDVTPDERAGPNASKTAKKQQQPPAKQVSVTSRHEETVYVENTLEILEGILGTVKANGNNTSSDVAEYYMLPPRDPSRPGNISGSFRIFHRGARAKELVAEFCIGYLISAPTLLQQQELHYFFQIPPHNPLKLKHDATEVFLDKCKAHKDDASGRGFRLAMELPLASYSLPAIAELLDYLLSNTNRYLS
ncbi:hypothetical protein KRP22_002701 [Phytophthora ramorum]|nr:Small glutamine-rich tetratricopeptide repeat-containing protein beta [Phytophthora ramorum]